MNRYEDRMVYPATDLTMWSCLRVWTNTEVGSADQIWVR